jgi:hypothetical protein
MTKTEYRATLDQLGFTQVALCRLLDYDDRTSRRWADGSQPVPVVVAFVLRLMVEYGVTPELAVEIAGGPKPARRRRKAA